MREDVTQSGRGGNDYYFNNGGGTNVFHGDQSALSNDETRLNQQSARTGGANNSMQGGLG